MVRTPGMPKPLLYYKQMYINKDHVIEDLPEAASYCLISEYQEVVQRYEPFREDLKRRPRSCSIEMESGFWRLVMIEKMLNRVDREVRRGHNEFPLSSIIWDTEMMHRLEYVKDILDIHEKDPAGMAPFPMDDQNGKDRTTICEYWAGDWAWEWVDAEMKKCMEALGDAVQQEKDSIREAQEVAGGDLGDDAADVA